MKRPAAIDFWELPAYYNGPIEDAKDTEEVNNEEQQQAQSPAADQRAEEYRNEGTSSKNKGLNPTCVTPLIENLSQHLYRALVVAGPEIQNIDLVTKRTLVRNRQYIEYMDQLLEIVHGPPSHVAFDDNCHIVGTRSQIKDIVIVPAGVDGKHPVPTFPTKASRLVFAGDLFWFARILAIKRDNMTAHVQWFQHGCKTIIEEFAHPQELFLTDLCSDIPLHSFLARCKCQRVPAGERPRTLVHDEFFYSLSVSQADSVFREITELENEPSIDMLRTGGCGLCLANQDAPERGNANCTRLLRDSLFIGLAYQGVNYHCWDVALIRSEDGPCNIGQIISITEDLTSYDFEPFKITVRLFGRVNDLARQGTDLTAGVHEDRHLFLTDEELNITFEDLLGKCYVLQKNTIRNLRVWLEFSPLHFYVTQCAPSLGRASSAALAPLAAKDFPLCGGCSEAEVHQSEAFLRWKSRRKERPLRVFDPFAGVGAFALGVCQVGNMKLTHAIEIAPSAAKTLKENSPGTIVYNQCSNKMLEYTVSRANGVQMSLQDLLDGETLPPPPKREDIDCIISGFPCQPHSKLNRFQKAEDLQNELFLNMLSWVEHLQPNYCLFENVEGFTSQRINATQRDRHTVQGGIEKGGIKFLVRALTAMGYQVRFGLLQAAHYGTPQSRVRFFLWAVRTGYPLPSFPARTHDFPRTMSMMIKFPNGDIVAPVLTARGVAPQPFVTVRDAISDLKRWDWENPHKIYRNKARQERVERRDVLQVKSHYGDDYCGLVGEIPYEHPPRSAFQARSRRRPAKDIQHITPCLRDEVLESIVNISLESGANYKSLNNKPLLWRWQVMAALSANARRGYKGSMYTRLEADGYFNTIVTNVGVTAKQSKVLNPWCKRIVTVRELARSQGFPDDFLFCALDENVRTMHKQIGNAVPWPLSEALGRELERALYQEQDSQGGMDE